MRTERFHAVAALAAALLACRPDDGGDSDGAGSSSTSGATVEAGSSTGDAGEPTTSGATGEAGSSTGGEPGTTGGAASLCEQHCAHKAECDEYADEECVRRCEDGVGAYHYLGEVCGLRREAYLQCELAASCEALAGHPDPCEDEFAALIDPVCVLPACEALCDTLAACGQELSQGVVYCGFECSDPIGYAAVEQSPECAAAIEATILCHSQLSCEQIEQDVTCEAEIAAHEAICGW